MVEILKVVYALIIFLSLTLFVTNASKFFFNPISNYLLYHIHNHSSLFSNILLFLFAQIYCFVVLTRIVTPTYVAVIGLRSVDGICAAARV